MAKYSRITREGSKSFKIAVVKQNRNSRSCCGLTKEILKDFESTPAKNS